MENREEYIKQNLKEHYDEALTLNKELFCIVLQGSQNYNLDLYTKEYKSDIDTKAIVLPSFIDFCKGSQPLSTTHIRQNDEHIDLKDIRVIFETFKKQNVNFVEILFSDYYIVPDKYKKYWERLRALGEDLTHCHPSQTIKTMAGLSGEKLKALCHPYPTIKDKIDKYGYDGKQLHHIIRVNEFIKNYVNGMSFKDCLTTYSDQTIELCYASKLNMYSLAEALEIAEKLNNQTNLIKNTYIEKYGSNIISDRPYKELEEIKVDVLKQWFKEELK